MNGEEQVIVSMLTAYRAVPAMLSALSGNKVALADVMETINGTLGANYNGTQVLEMLKTFEGWIRYTAADFKKYSEKIGDKISVELYMQRMQEESMLVNRLYPFHMNLENLRILDVGAGCSPYMRHFAETNKCRIDYYSLDKAENEKHYPLYDNLHSYTLKGRVDTVADLGDYAVHEPNVLFMANFLHCLPFKFFGDSLDSPVKYLPKLKRVVIIEQNPGTPLDSFFNFHMFEHCNGFRVKLDEVGRNFRDMGYTARIIPAGKFHTMLKVEIE